MVGGLSIVFRAKAVVDETLIWDSTNWCKSIVGVHASQLYPFSMCQAMPNGLYSRLKLDSKSGKFKPRQNKTKSFKKLVMCYFQRVRPQYKVESFYTTGAEKKNYFNTVHGFCGHCNTVVEVMGC